MFFKKVVTTIKNDTENQEKIDEETISNNANNMLWDNLLNKILDNYTDFEFDIIRTEHTEYTDFYTVNFVYNNKIYIVVRESYAVSNISRERNYSLYGIKNKKDDENITYVQDKNILPLKPKTKERFDKVLNELRIIHENRQQAKIDQENLEIYK